MPPIFVSKLPRSSQHSAKQQRAATSGPERTDGPEVSRSLRHGHLRSGAEVAAFVERNADRTAVVMAAIGAALYPNAAFPQPQGKGKVQWCVGLLQRPPPHAVRTFSHDLSQ